MPIWAGEKYVAFRWMDSVESGGSESIYFPLFCVCDGFGHKFCQLLFFTKRTNGCTNGSMVLSYHLNSAYPSPYSHCGHLMLMLWAGTRLPCRHKCVAWMIWILRWVLIYPHTCEWGFCHFSASLANRHLANVLALWPIIPFVKTTKGVKWWCCSRQASRYFCLFSFSCVFKMLAGFLVQ
jgi:hypothetical protein